MKKKIIPFLLGIFIGIIVSGTCVYAATLYEATEVSYDNSNSGSSSVNVQNALDELYEKVKENSIKVRNLYLNNTFSEITGISLASGYGSVTKNSGYLTLKLGDNPNHTNANSSTYRMNGNITIPAYSILEIDWMGENDYYTMKLSCNGSSVEKRNNRGKQMIFFPNSFSGQLTFTVSNHINGSLNMRIYSIKLYETGLEI